jgi:hypothetical protein
MKLAKDREKVTQILSDTVKMQKGFERLVVFVLTLLLFGHLAACIWVFMAKTLSTT